MTGGTLHLVKLAVGIDDVAQFRTLQAARFKAKGEIAHLTRHRPKRAEELLAGGSLYWVVRGAIRVRQPILDLRTERDDEGVSRCAIVLEPVLTETENRPFRPFQGWRYLEVDRAPPDASGDGVDALPAALSAELRALGIL